MIAAWAAPELGPFTARLRGVAACAGQRCFAAASAQATGAELQVPPGINPSISVHNGFKVQAALCVERPPLKIMEPDYKKEWSQFKDAWEKRTDNNVTLEDDIVFMRYHFQFLEDAKAARAISGSAPKASIPSGDGKGGVLATLGGGGGGALDQLLSNEGLNIAFPQKNQKVTKRTSQKTKTEEVIDDSNLREMRRLADKTLFLLVRYANGSKWTFPKADRPHAQPMSETLYSMCEQQLGQEFEPYVIGACPFSHRKRRSDKVPGIEGRKVFYYRARAVPGPGAAVVPPPADAGGIGVSDWAWIPREELPRMLDDSEWHAVRDGLPLDCVE